MRSDPEAEAIRETGGETRLHGVLVAALLPATAAWPSFRLSPCRSVTMEPTASFAVVAPDDGAEATRVAILVSCGCCEFPSRLPSDRRGLSCDRSASRRLLSRRKSRYPRGQRSQSRSRPRPLPPRRVVVGRPDFPPPPRRRLPGRADRYGPRAGNRGLPRQAQACALTDCEESARSRLRGDQSRQQLAAARRLRDSPERPIRRRPVSVCSSLLAAARHPTARPAAEKPGRTGGLSGIGREPPSGLSLRGVVRNPRRAMVSSG